MKNRFIKRAVLAASGLLFGAGLAFASGPMPTPSAEPYNLLVNEKLTHEKAGKVHVRASSTGMRYVITRIKGKTLYSMSLLDSGLALGGGLIYAKFGEPGERAAVVVKEADGSLAMLADGKGKPYAAPIDVMLAKSSEETGMKKPLAAVPQNWDGMVNDVVFGKIPVTFSAKPFTAPARGGETQYLMIQYRGSLAGKVEIDGYLVIDAGYEKPILARMNQERRENGERVASTRDFVMSDANGAPLMSRKDIPAGVASHDGPEHGEHNGYASAAPLSSTGAALAHVASTDLAALTAAEQQTNPLPVAAAIVLVNVDGAIEMAMNLAGSAGLAALDGNSPSVARDVFASMGEYQGAVQTLAGKVGGDNGQAIANIATAMLGVTGATKSLFTAGTGDFINAIKGDRIANLLPDPSAFAQQVITAALAPGRSPALNNLIGGLLAKEGLVEGVVNPKVLSGIIEKIASQFDGKVAQFLAKNNFADEIYGLASAKESMDKLIQEKAAAATSQAMVSGLAASGISPIGVASSLFVGGYLNINDDLYMARFGNDGLGNLMSMYTQTLNAISLERARQGLNLVSGVSTPPVTPGEPETPVVTALEWIGTTPDDGGVIPPSETDKAWGFGGPPVIPAGATTYFASGEVYVTYTARPGTFNAPVSVVYAFWTQDGSFPVPTVITSPNVEGIINSPPPGKAMPTTVPVQINVQAIEPSYQPALYDWVTASDRVDVPGGGYVRVIVPAPVGGGVLVIENR